MLDFRDARLLCVSSTRFAAAEVQRRCESTKYGTIREASFEPNIFFVPADASGIGGNMSVQLLDKTRKINKLLHNNNSSKVVFNDICEVLTEILDSNILVISKKGKVLGVSLCPGVEEIKELIDDEVGGYIDVSLVCFPQRKMSTWRHWDL